MDPEVLLAPAGVGSPGKPNSWRRAHGLDRRSISGLSLVHANSRRGARVYYCLVGFIRGGVQRTANLALDLWSRANRVDRAGFFSFVVLPNRFRLAAGVSDILAVLLSPTRRGGSRSHTVHLADFVLLPLLCWNGCWAQALRPPPAILCTSRMSCGTIPAWPDPGASLWPDIPRRPGSCESDPQS
jgi:hypothetical protein